MCSINRPRWHSCLLQAGRRSWLRRIFWTCGFLRMAWFGESRSWPISRQTASNKSARSRAPSSPILTTRQSGRRAWSNKFRHLSRTGFRRSNSKVQDFPLPSNISSKTDRYIFGKNVKGKKGAFLTWILIAFANSCSIKVYKPVAEQSFGVDLLDDRTRAQFWRVPTGPWLCHRHLDPLSQ